MRKLRVSILLTIVALFMFAAMIGPTQKVNAVLREKYYTVRWNGCGFSPYVPSVEGEWYVDCDGNWDGWGCKPNECVCTSFEVTLGEQCYE